MLEILLVRHGQTDWNRERRIMGGHPIPLNRIGRRESQALAKMMGGVKIHGLFTSPILRAEQTAVILARGRSLKVKPTPALAEIGYGDWIGKRFYDLKSEKNFKVYHSTPRHACAPGGEKMIDVQKRAVKFVESLRKKYKKGRFVLVSHADVIKLIITHYLGLDANDILKLRIDNSSLSFLWLNDQRDRVLAMNVLHCPDRLFLDLLGPDKARKSKK